MAGLNAKIDENYITAFCFPELLSELGRISKPKCTMCGIFTYIWLEFVVFM